MKDDAAYATAKLVSIEERQWQTEMEDEVWNASDRTVIARMEQYLEKKSQPGGGSWGVGVSAWPRRLGSGYQVNLGGSEERKGSHDLSVL